MEEYKADLTANKNALGGLSQQVEKLFSRSYQEDLVSKLEPKFQSEVLSIRTLISQNENKINTILDMNDINMDTEKIQMVSANVQKVEAKFREALETIEKALKNTREGQEKRDSQVEKELTQLNDKTDNLKKTLEHTMISRNNNLIERINAAKDCGLILA